MIPTKKYKVKVVARLDPSSAAAQPPQTNAKAPVISESQKPSTSENNPQPLENAPVHASTPWPEAGKMYGNLFELRKDWPISPTNNTMTATNPKPPIKMEPQEQDQPTPVLQHKNQSDVDGDQTVPFARMQKKTGMANIKSNSSKPTKTLEHKICSRPDPKHKANSGSEPSVHPRLPGTTKPTAHLDTILQCTGWICKANLSKKRVGGEDGKAQ